MPNSHILCWLSAIIFIAASSMIIAQYVQMKNEQFSRENYDLLLPDNIEQDWLERYDTRGLWFASGFTNAFFWIIFTLPIIEMAWILSKSGTRSIGLSVGICVLAIGGAFTEWLAHLFWIGVTTASFTLSNEFNLDVWIRPDVAANLGVSADDGMGWRDLEVNHITTSGMIWIVNSFEWLCLGGIFCFTFVSVYQWRNEDQDSFGARWNALGLFIGLLAIVEFGAEIARFEGFRVAGPIVLLYAALNRLILIPAWIIALGFQLPKAAAKHFDSHIAPLAEDLSLTEQLVGSDQQHNPGTFTIGDDDNDGGLQPPAAATPPPQKPAGPSSPPAEAFAIASSLASPISSEKWTQS